MWCGVEVVASVWEKDGEGEREREREWRGGEERESERERGRESESERGKEREVHCVWIFICEYWLSYKCGKEMRRFIPLSSLAVFGQCPIIILESWELAK